MWGRCRPPGQPVPTDNLPSTLMLSSCRVRGCTQLRQPRAELQQLCTTVLIHCPLQRWSQRAPTRLQRSLGTEKGDGELGNLMQSLGKVQPGVPGLTAVCLEHPYSADVSLFLNRTPATLFPCPKSSPVTPSTPVLSCLPQPSLPSSHRLSQSLITFLSPQSIPAYLSAPANPSPPLPGRAAPPTWGVPEGAGGAGSDALVPADDSVEPWESSLLTCSGDRPSLLLSSSKANASDGLGKFTCVPAGCGEAAVSGVPSRPRRSARPRAAGPACSGSWPRAPQPRLERARVAASGWAVPGWRDGVSTRQRGECSDRSETAVCPAVPGHVRDQISFLPVPFFTSCYRLRTWCSRCSNATSRGKPLTEDSITGLTGKESCRPVP